MSDITSFNEVRGLFTSGAANNKRQSKTMSNYLKMKQQIIADLNFRIEMLWLDGKWGERVYRSKEIIFGYFADAFNCHVDFYGLRVLSNSQNREDVIKSSTDGYFFDLRKHKDANFNKYNKETLNLYNCLKEDGFKDCFITTNAFCICIDLNAGYSKNSEIGKIVQKINDYNREFEEKINNVAKMMLNHCYNVMLKTKQNSELWSKLESVKTMGFLFEISGIRLEKLEYPLRFNGFFYKFKSKSGYNNISNQDKLIDIEYYSKIRDGGRYIGEDLKLLCKYLYELGADDIFIYDDMDIAVTININ